MEEKKINSFDIIKVDKDTELAELLIEFIANFSWDDGKKHTLCVLRNGELTDRDTMVASGSKFLVYTACIMQ